MSADNCQRLLLWLVETGRFVTPPGAILNVDFEHDRWCARQRTAGRAPCDCEPNFVGPDGRVWTWAHYEANNP